MSDDLLTKYEAARVLGMRFLQIQQGDATLAPEYEGGSTRAACVRELLAYENPLTIHRIYPNGREESKRVRDLRIPMGLRELLQQFASM